MKVSSLSTLVSAFVLALVSFPETLAQDTLTLCSPCPNDSSWQEHTDTISWGNETDPCEVIFTYEKRTCDADYCTEVRLKDFLVEGNCVASIQDPAEVVASVLVNVLYDHPYDLLPEMEINGYECLRIIQPQCWKSQGVNCETDEPVVPTLTQVRFIPCDPEACCTNYLQAWEDECGQIYYLDKSMRVLNAALGDEAEAAYDSDTCDVCTPPVPTGNEPPDDCEDACHRQLVRFMMENWRSWEASGQ